MHLKALEIPKPLHMASNFSRASVLIEGGGLRRSCVAQGMRLVMQMRESMAGPIADLSRTYRGPIIQGQFLLTMQAVSHILMRLAG